MPHQIYRYRVQRLLGQSATNEVFEAHDPVLDQTVKIYRCTPPPDSLDSSLVQLDSCLPGIAEFGVEVFSEAGSICLAATNDGATRAALNKLRASGLFQGYWPEIFPEPAPLRNFPISTDKSAAMKSVLPLTELAPTPPHQRQPAEKSGSFWWVALSGIALAGVFVAVELHQSPVPSASPSYLPEKLAPNSTSTPTSDAKVAPQRSQLKRVLPSFDCAKARTPDELLICRNSQLAQLDVEMVAAYQHALENLPPDARRDLERAHLKWFINYSRTCNASADEEQRISCIANFLEQHSGELKKRDRQ